MTDHRHALDRAYRIAYDSSMNWKKLISDIQAAGHSQGWIASELGIKQPSVSDIANGNTKNPTWVVGNNIVKLHRRVMRSRAKAA